MFTIKRLSRIFLFLLLVLGFQIVLILNAQAECEALITSAFESIEDTCGNLEGNSGCTTDIGQVAPVSDFQSLNSSQTTENLSIGLMNVSANVPLGLSEEGMRLFLIGDVTVENAVDPASAFEPAQGATISTIVGANIRSIPSPDGRLVTTATVGTEFIADGLSSDSQWVNIITDVGTAWISRQIIAVVEGDLDSLPVITNDSRTLWQELFLSMNASSGCSETLPPLLYIQGPDNMLASMTVNNVEVRINSEIALHISNNNVMSIYTLEGVAISDGISVPAGFTMSIQLSEDGRDRNGSWTNLRPIESFERDFLVGLQLLPTNTLYRAVEVPSQEEVSELLSVINQASAGAGQTVVTAAGQGKIDCSGFQPTFPLDVLTPGVAPFYWDGAVGAEAYNLNFYDVGGAFLGSVAVNANNPTYQVDPGNFAEGRGQFAWAVDALVDGQVACTTGRAIVQRVGDAQPVSGNDNNEPQPEPTACKWNQC